MCRVLLDRLLRLNGLERAEAPDEIEDAIVELAEMIAAQEDALCELAEMIGGDE